MLVEAKRDWMQQPHNITSYVDVEVQVVRERLCGSPSSSQRVWSSVKCFIHAVYLYISLNGEVSSVKSCGQVRETERERAIYTLGDVYERQEKKEGEKKKSEIGIL